jgi:HD-like signal output (HDOD) protein
MPGVSGIELLERLKKDQRTCALPVIMLTNAADLEVARAAFALGARDYVLKAGFSLSALLERVEHVLAHPSPVAVQVVTSASGAGKVRVATPVITAGILASPQPVTSDAQHPLRLVRERAAARAFPGALTEILGLVAAAQGSVTDLVAALRRDPALSARVLKAANSAAVGHARSISSLDDAAQVLGTKVIRDLALGMGLFSPSDGEDAHRCLLHSLATGLFMERFTADLAEAGLGYAVGLCHELGDLAVRDALAQPLADAATLAAREGLSLVDAERRVLGTSRSRLAIAAFETMKLPEGVAAPIVDLLSDERMPAQGTRTRRLQLAETYANALMLAWRRDGEVCPLKSEDLADLGPAGRNPVWKEVKTQALASTAMAVGGPPPPPLFTARRATCQLVRAAGGLAGDPLTLALGGLCRLVERDRLPSSAAEWQGAPVLITVRGARREATGWVESLVAAVTAGPRSAPVLVIADVERMADLPTGVSAMPARTSLDALDAVVRAGE